MMASKSGHTSNESGHSPIIHFRYYEPKQGKEDRLLSALAQAASAAEQIAGVEMVSVFKQAYGKGGMYLLAVNASDSGVLERLRAEPRLRSLGSEIDALAAQANIATFNRPG
jgi:hypothetical protein